MKLHELFHTQLNEMGIFGKKVKIKANATGSAEAYAGKIGKIVNISPEHDKYYLEFEDGNKTWVISKNIEGVSRQ